MNLGPFAVSGYHVGDCRDLLRKLPDGCIHCCVTSPPYWGLRDYRTGTWEGGDPDCDHVGKLNSKRDTSGGTNGRFADTRGQQPAKAYSVPLLGDCPCGARRVDSQLGLEATPEAMGCNVTETLCKAGVALEWPPVNMATLVAFAGVQREEAIERGRQTELDLPTPGGGP